MADLLRAHSEAVRRRMPVRMLVEGYVPRGKIYALDEGQIETRWPSRSWASYRIGEYLTCSGDDGVVRRRVVDLRPGRSITLGPSEPVSGRGYRPLSTRAVHAARPQLDAMQDAAHSRVPRN